MPTAVPTGSIVQVLIQYDLESQQCENVIFFRCYNDDVDMLLNLLTVIAHCFITHLVPVLGSNCTLTGVKGKIVGPAVGAEDMWVPSGTDTVNGAVTTDTLPSFTSAVISLRTAHAGKSGHGRIFIGGIAAADTLGSLLKLEAPTWAALAAFVACIIAAFPRAELGTGAHYEWGVYSRKLGAVTKPPYPDAGFLPITAAIRRRELGTTRSRKLGHGK